MSVLHGSQRRRALIWLSERAGAVDLVHVVRLGQDVERLA